MASWKGAGGLQELVSEDPFISKHLKAAEIRACFDPKYYLRHMDRIYRRVFGKSTRGRKQANRRRGGR
jgi:adenylosuccinate lyase